MPPPASQGSKGCGKALLIVGILVAILAALAVGAFFLLRDRVQEFIDEEFGDAPRSAYEIQPTACGTEEDGSPTFRMEFTNTAGTRREYRVTVVFVSGDRELTSEVIVNTGSLPDGGTVSLEADGEPIEEQSFTCKVKRVQFFGR
jgi:hypothetical protein